MKNYLFFSLFFVALLIETSPLQAQNSGFGIGAMLNDPTGISMKGWVNEDFAIDAALSFGVGREFSEFYLHADALMHSDADNSDFELENGLMRLYYGLGTRLIWVDESNDFFAGVRVPVGITYGSEEAPVDAFFELIPTIDITPRFRFGFAGALGFRIFLANSD